MAQKFHFWPFLMAQVLILIATTVQFTYAGTIRHDRNDSDYIALAAQYPSVGHLSTGSGTLIAPNYVLTAAHVVANQPVASISFWLDDPPMVPVPATSKFVPDQYTLSNLGWDIAVVRLNKSILDVSPAELYTGSDEVGKIGAIVGVGEGGNGLDGEDGNQGIKRAGDNMIDAAGGFYNHYLYADFDNPEGGHLNQFGGSPIPIYWEYCFATGDSGGPVFIDDNGQQKVAGINSHGWPVIDYKYGTGMGFTRVSLFISWINSIISAGEPDWYEPDNSSLVARWIYNGLAQTHSISPADDVDWFKFSLSTESQVTIETSGSSGDSRMWLKDSGLFHIEYDDNDGNDLFSHIDRMCGVDALPAGTYYVKIDSKDNNHEIPSYTITLSITPCGSGNHNPQLSNGSVNRGSGYASTDFYWHVDYYDEDGDPPTTKNVYIDSTDYEMSLYSGSASNGTYRYGPKNLSVGSHNYYFYFSDGNGGSDRLPPGSGAYPGPSVSSPGAVYFPDPNLKIAIEEELGISNPTPADMLNLSFLNAYFSGINNLTGLEYAMNLTTLWLGLNRISDISALSGLTNLEDLYLRGNPISDISVLSRLTNLQYLEMFGNHISDISALSGLTNLTELNLGYNQISNISALSGLTNLGKLHLDDNQISDISALSGLTNLWKLDLRWNPLNTAAYCTYLPLIRANNPGIILDHDPNPDPGAQCPVSIPDYNLKNAVEQELAVSDPTEADMLTLTYLDASSRRIADLTGLEYATNLAELLLSDNQISDISVLSEMVNMERLFLSQNHISNISALSGLTNLTYLELGGNPLNIAAYCTYLPLIIDNNPGLGQLFYDSNPLDFSEFATFAAYWQDIGCGVCGGADLDQDNDVDFEDLAIFAGNWLGQRACTYEVVNLTRLTNGPIQESGPTFNADGTKIAYRYLHEPYAWHNCDIWVMNVDGSEPNRITTDSRGEFGPSFVPDGRITYTKEFGSNDYDIWMVDGDGGNPHSFIGGSYRQTTSNWHPSGNKLVYCSEYQWAGPSEIWTADANGSNLTPLTDHTVDGYGQGSPVYSRSGNLIAYANYATNGEQPHIWIMNADGSGKQQITFGAEGQNPMFWWPDDSRIGYTQNGELWLHNLTTGTDELLLAVPNGSIGWCDLSLDGAKVVFDLSDLSGGHIWIGDVVGN